MALAKRNNARGQRPKILEARALVPDDLRVLQENRRGRQTLAELRDSHHLVARLVASGLRFEEVAERSGYTIASVYRFNIDPAFNELVAQYRKIVEGDFREELDEYGKLLLTNRMKAERRLADRLDDDEATISTRDLITVSRDAADRTGYGKHSTQLSAKVDVATLLEEARARSKLGPPMLEVSASRPSATDVTAPTPLSQGAPVLLNRRGL